LGEKTEFLHCSSLENKLQVKITRSRALIMHAGMLVACRDASGKTTSGANGEWLGANGTLGSPWCTNYCVFIPFFIVLLVGNS